MNRTFFFVCVVLIAIALLAVGCGRAGENGESSDSAQVEDSVEGRDLESLRVLFIGNSLTYSNDLPGMVGLLFQQAGLEGYYIESIAFPNFGLPDHWGRLDVKGAITEGDWDYVVLQQGPSATEGRPYLLDYVKRFDELIRESGAETAVYMVWPARSRFSDFDGVLDSYRTAAESVNAIFLPAGEAWRTAWAQDESLALYGPDNFHPSPMGSYLAALVIFQGLTGLDPRDSSLELAFSPAVFELLQGAASETTSRYSAQRDN